MQELKRYQISSQRLQQTIAKQELPQTLFTCKLRELAALYDRYDGFLAQDYLDSEDVLELFVKTVGAKKNFCKIRKSG